MQVTAYKYTNYTHFLTHIQTKCNVVKVKSGEVEEVFLTVDLLVYRQYDIMKEGKECERRRRKRK